MAKAKRKRKGTSRRKVRGGGCGVERVGGYRRRVCRDAKGRITKSTKVGRRKARRGKGRKRKSGSARRRVVRRTSGRMVCPKRFDGKPVRSKNKRCYIIRPNGSWRWVKKVRGGRRRRK